MTTLEAFSRIHVVGAGGSGMAPLAKLLAGMGHTVSGSDLKPGRRLDALADLGIETWVGHRPEAVSGVDLLVSSSAVPPHDVEIAAADAAGVAVWARPDLLDALTTTMPAVGFTGTHGKTTSTGMAVHALRAAGEDPSFVIGSELVELNTGAHLGDRELFLIEADEAFGTFRHLHMTGLLVTNIEPDHLDYYGNVATLEEAFALVARRTDGPVVACIDDEGVRRLAERVHVVGYGTGDATWRIDDVLHAPGTVSYTLSGHGTEVPVTVPLPGMHTARNSAGVLALLAELGFDVASLAAGLASFAGVKRRFEVLARVAGVTIVDDYAHHPTEVAATVDAATQGAAAKVWVVFQPHRYSRTAQLAPEFGRPLARADGVFVTDVYAAGEAPLPGVSGRIVAEAVAAAGGTVEYIPAPHDVPAALASELGPGDVVLLLGAGDVNAIAADLVTTLEVPAS